MPREAIRLPVKWACLVERGPDWVVAVRSVNGGRHRRRWSLLEGRGMGAATSRLLAARGMRVAVNYRAIAQPQDAAEGLTFLARHNRKQGCRDRRRPRMEGNHV
jgi:hypothetical protein